MHLFAVVFYIVPFGIGRDPMVRTGNITAKSNQRLKAADFLIDCFLIFGENIFVHAANSADLVAVDFFPGGNAGVPGADFNGEHGIDAMIHPGRNQRINHSIAVKGDYVDSVFIQKFGDFLIMRSYFFIKYIRDHERTVFKTNVFPEMCEVKGPSLIQDVFDCLEAQSSYGIDNFVVEVLIICKEITDSFYTYDISDSSEETSAVQSDRSVRVCSFYLFIGLSGNALRLKLKTPFIFFFPGFSVFQGVFYFSGN